MMEWEIDAILAVGFVSAFAIYTAVFLIRNRMLKGIFLRRSRVLFHKYGLQIKRIEWDNKYLSDFTGDRFAKGPKKMMLFLEFWGEVEVNLSYCRILCRDSYGYEYEVYARLGTSFGLIHNVSYTPPLTEIYAKALKAWKDPNKLH